MKNKSFKDSQNQDSEFNDDIVLEENMEDLGEINHPDSDKKIKKLEKELSKCKEDNKAYLLGWQRSKADYINFKKRQDKNTQDLNLYITEKIVQEFLAPLDTFEMAMKNQEVWNQAPQNWRLGIEHIYNQLLTALENIGVTEIKSEGQEFDSNKHEALENIETDKKEEDNLILEVVIKGYELKDRVIRPAKVKVGKFEN